MANIDFDSLLVEIIENANNEAYAASKSYFDNKLGGQDSFPCGFAWVNITGYQGKKITGNTKVGRSLKKAGVRQNYNRKFQIWHPGKFMCQNVDTLTAGADAAVKVFKEAGFDAYSDSRLD